MDAATVSLIFAAILAFANLVLVRVTFFAVREAARSRQIATETLAELRAEHQSPYEADVIPLPWDGSDAIQFVNLGLGLLVRHSGYEP